MYAVTGATGNTGSVVAENLLAKGEKVRAIGRDSARLERFVKKGAEAFVGDVEDAAAMAKAFTGATGVYLVIPQALQRDDFRAYQDRISDAYASALAEAGVRHAVSLSSIGAQHAEKTGPIIGLHRLEEKLNRVPRLNVLHLRAGFFLENLFMSIDAIRGMGAFPGVFSGDAPFPMIATKDIGAAAAERLKRLDFTDQETGELLGQRDVTMKEVAAIIGQAIGKPGLGYTQVPTPVLTPSLAQMGLPRSCIALLMETWKAANDGLLAPLEKRSAQNTTPTSIETFIAEEFLPRFRAKGATAS
jgi:uncharacterized protein YbjT (DUF2867 family)